MAEGIGSGGSGESSRAERSNGPVTYERAKEIIGADCVFGIPEIERVFGARMEKVPPIPFSEQLMRSLTNPRLVFFTPTIPLQGEVVDATANRLKIVFPEYFNGVRFLGETDDMRTTKPRPRWFLVDETPLSESGKKDLLAQTDQVASVVEGLLNQAAFGDSKEAGYYRSALREYVDVRSAIKQKIDYARRIDELPQRHPDRTFDALRQAGATRREAQQMIFNLSINRLTRLTLAEAVQLAVVQRQLTGELPFSGLSQTFQLPITMNDGNALVMSGRERARWNFNYDMDGENVLGGTARFLAF